MTAEIVDGVSDTLFLCDHASNHVPADIELGIAPDRLERHIGYDIGAGPLTRALAARLGAPAVLGTVSRLVIDLHRPPDHPGLVPVESDGHAIPGNVGVHRAARIARFFAPYHRAVAAEVRTRCPRLIVAIHSFTPQLEAGNAPWRQWEVGILSNRDRRAADAALVFLAGERLVVGDNEPYSGRLLNMTLNRHAEARAIPSLSVEVRNDLIRNDAGVARWYDIIARMSGAIRNSLARDRPRGT